MRSWFLGGFLARRSRLATRYLAAVAGLSLAVALCLLSGVLQFLDRSAEKADARQFGPEVAAGCTVGVTRSDQFDQRSYQRVVIGRVLRPRCDDEFAVPPGLTRFPSPGEVFVSPALAELRGAEPALAERFPVITGTIGRDGLLASNELSVIVGGRSDVFDRRFGVATFDRFGASIDWITTYLRTEPTTLRNIGILFCLPLSIWLIYVATSVNARVRRRQLGVLAVVGLDGLGTCRALVTEAVLSVGAGAVAGAAASKLFLASATPTFTGLQAFPGDYEPAWSTLLWVVLVVVAVAAGASMLAALRAVYTSRQSDRGARRWLPAVAAVTLLTGVGLGVAGLLSFRFRFQETLILCGRIVTFIGIVTIVPTLARAVGGVLRQRQTVPGEIIGNRLRRPAGSLTRAVSILAGGLFIVALAQAETAAIVEDPEALAEEYSRDGRSLLSVRYPNAEVLRLLEPYDMLAGRDPAGNGTQVLQGTCQTVRDAAGSTGPCPESGIYFTYGTGEAVDDVLRRLDFPVVSEVPAGPRGDQLLEVVVRLTQPGDRIARPDTVYVPVPADDAESLYNQIIAVDPDVNVRLAGTEFLLGTTELNSIADLSRWGGYFAVISSLIGAGTAVIALAYDRRLATRYLEVLGLTRLRSTAALVAELLLVAIAATALAVMCAWLWAAVYALGGDDEPIGLATAATPFVWGLLGASVTCLIIAAPAMRAAQTTAMDGDVDLLANVRPFARSRPAERRRREVPTPNVKV